jgi:ribulose-5-phosphate 4-epimerase/fuculose-1-phosphate aldolase
MAVLRIEDAKLRAEIESLKEEVAVATRGLVKFGLVPDFALAMGHCSARIPHTDWFICKGRGYRIDSLSKMTADDMVIYDLDCNVLEAPPGVGPVLEIKSHAEIYKARPDVGAVVHCHPPFVYFLSLLDKPILPIFREGCEMFLKPIPTFTGTRRIIALQEDAEALAKALGDSWAIIHKWHGAFTVGYNVGHAFCNMLVLETNARFNFLAMLVAGRDHPHLDLDLIKEATEFLEDRTGELRARMPWLNYYRRFPDFLRRGTAISWEAIKDYILSS